MPNPLNVSFNLKVAYDFAGIGYSSEFERIENTDIVLANNISETEKYFRIKITIIPSNKDSIKKLKRMEYLDEKDQNIPVLINDQYNYAGEGNNYDNFIEAELGRKYKFRVKVEFTGTDDNDYVEETNYVSFTTIEKSDFVEVDKIQIFLDNSTEFGKKFKSINIPMIPLVFKNETKMVVSKADLLKFIVKQDCINPLAYYEKEYVTEVFGTITGKVETDYKGKAFYKGSDLIDFLKH